MRFNYGWLLFLVLALFLGCGPEPGDATSGAEVIDSAADCRMPVFRHHGWSSRPLPECTYTYSSWGECQPGNTQTRTVLSQSPRRCTGTPALEQWCQYFPPGPQATVAWTATDPELGEVVPITEVGLHEVASVFIVTDWVPEPYTQVYLSITAPSGALYYGQWIPWDYPPDAIWRTYTLSDGRHRVVEQVLIRGTTIEMYAQTGQWKARARTDWTLGPDVTAVLTLL